jgi:hypothetical protein
MVAGPRRPPARITSRLPQYRNSRRSTSGQLSGGVNQFVCIPLPLGASERLIGPDGGDYSIAIHEIRLQIQTRYQLERTMKGTILDFLNLATDKPELAKELVALATKYDFEFTSDELSDTDLDSVAGGGSIEEWEEQLNSMGDDSQLANIDLQNMLQKQQQTIQMMSNISKVMHDTSMAVIRKIG